MFSFIQSFFWELLIILGSGVLFAIISFFSSPFTDPYLKPKKEKFIRWVKRKQGREKRVTVVSVRLFENGRTGEKRSGLPYEVELPYESIDENSMSIEESDRLIIEAINKKYGKNYSPRGVALNNVSPKKEIRYE